MVCRRLIEILPVVGGGNRFTSGLVQRFETGGIYRAEKAWRFVGFVRRQAGTNSGARKGEE